MNADRYYVAKRDLTQLHGRVLQVRLSAAGELHKVMVMAERPEHGRVWRQVCSLRRLERG